MNVYRYSVQTLIKDGMQMVGARRFFWGKAPAGPWRFRASVLCSSILRPVETSDAPAGTSLHRLPLHRCPARIAVSASASLSLISVAGQQGNVGTYRQGASVVFQNERMPAQAQTLIKRRYAKRRCAEVLLGEGTGWPAEVQVGRLVIPLSFPILSHISFFYFNKDYEICILHSRLLFIRNV